MSDHPTVKRHELASTARRNASVLAGVALTLGVACGGEDPPSGVAAPLPNVHTEHQETRGDAPTVAPGLRVAPGYTPVAFGDVVTNVDAGPEFVKQALEAISESLGDLVAITGVDLARIATLLPVQVRLLEDGPMWREARDGFVGRDPGRAARDLLGTSTPRERTAWVLVPTTTPEYLGRVGLPAVVRETTLHELFHLVHALTRDDARPPPPWLEEGLAWAFADRALHRQIGGQRCLSCARGMMEFRLASGTVRFPGVRWVVARRAPEIAWTFFAGQLASVLIEGEGPGETRTIAPLVTRLRALPAGAGLDEELALLLEHARCAEEDLDARVQAHLDAIDIEWTLAGSGMSIDALPDGSIVVAPFGPGPAGVARTRRPDEAGFRVEALLEGLDGGRYGGISLGFGSQRKSFGVTWDLEQGAVWFVDGRITDPAHRSSRPFDLLEDRSDLHAGDPLPIAVEVWPDRFLAYLRPLAKGEVAVFEDPDATAIAEGWVVFAVQGGPMVVRDVRIASR